MQSMKPLSILLPSHCPALYFHCHILMCCLLSGANCIHLHSLNLIHPNLHFRVYCIKFIRACSGSAVQLPFQHKTHKKNTAHNSRMSTDDNKCSNMKVYFQALYFWPLTLGPFCSSFHNAFKFFSQFYNRLN